MSHYVPPASINSEPVLTAQTMQEAELDVLPVLIPSNLDTPVLPTSPTPSKTVINTEVRTNVFRPDGRQRVETSVSANDLDPGYSIRLSRTDYENPETGVTQLAVTFILDEDSQTSITAGGALTEGDVIPEISVTTVVVDEENLRLRVYVERGLNTEDPRAVQALIQQNVVGLALSTGDLNTRYQVAFNSDDIEVHEGWVSIPINGNQALQFRSYIRAASGESDFYWDPRFFGSVGLLVGIPVATGEKFNAQIGVQPSLILSSDYGDSGVDLNPALPVGFRAQYVASENSQVEFDATLAYGLTASLRWSYNF